MNKTSCGQATQIDVGSHVSDRGGKADVKRDHENDADDPFASVAAPHHHVSNWE